MESIRANFQDAIIENGYMYFFDNLAQAICRAGINSFDMDIMEVYQGEKKFTARWIFSINEKFYLVSNCSLDILVYDRNKENERSFRLFVTNIVSSHMVTAFYYRSLIYFVPYYINESVAFFDAEKASYYEQDCIESRLNKKVGNHCPIVFSSFYQGVLYFAIHGKSLYVEYDLVKQKGELIKAIGTNACFDGICYDGTNIWLSEVNKPDIVIEGIKRSKILIPNGHSYSWIYNLERHIIILPKYSDKIIFIEKASLTVSEVILPISEKERNRNSGGSNFVNCFEDSNRLYLFPHGIKDLFIIQMNTFEIKRTYLTCDNYTVNVAKSNIDNHMINKEDNIINLRHLLEYCSHMDIEKQSIPTDNNIGKNIWEKVKS